MHDFQTIITANRSIYILSGHERSAHQQATLVDAVPYATILLNLLFHGWNATSLLLVYMKIHMRWRRALATLTSCRVHGCSIDSRCSSCCSDPPPRRRCLHHGKRRPHQARARRRTTRAPPVDQLISLSICPFSVVAFCFGDRQDPELVLVIVDSRRCLCVNVTATFSSSMVQPHFSVTALPFLHSRTMLPVPGTHR